MRITNRSKWKVELRSCDMSNVVSEIKQFLIGTKNRHDRLSSFLKIIFLIEFIFIWNLYAKYIGAHRLVPLMLSSSNFELNRTYLCRTLQYLSYDKESHPVHLDAVPVWYKCGHTVVAYCIKLLVSEHNFLIFPRNFLILSLHVPYLVVH